MRYFHSRDDEQHFVGDANTLQQQLEEAERTIQRLVQQISREQDRCTEMAQSYSKVVADLVKISRENAEIERERDVWRHRAEQRGSDVSTSTSQVQLTSAEVRAIRKAMARLHHPDTGGDAERMKAWNTVLDQLES